MIATETEERDVIFHMSRAGAVSSTHLVQGGSVTLHFADKADADRFHQAIADLGLAMKRNLAKQTV